MIERTAYMPTWAVVICAVFTIATTIYCLWKTVHHQEEKDWGEFALYLAGSFGVSLLFSACLAMLVSGKQVKISSAADWELILSFWIPVLIGAVAVFFVMKCISRIRRKRDEEGADNNENESE